MTCVSVRTWMLDTFILTVEDLVRAETAAADVDDLAIADGAWR